MNGELLLDTNAVIGVFANDPVVTAIVSQTSECFLPSIVLGELYYGAQRSTRTAENIAVLLAFCNTVTILLCDANTAAVDGRIKNELRVKGRPIPENDVWITAIATQHNLELLSRDDHFDEVDRLTRQSW